jgi:hypothetical protein
VPTELTDTGDRGAVRPAGGLLQHRLLPSARRRSDGRLFLDLGADRAAAAPGSAEPLEHALHRSCLGPPWWTVAAWVHGSSRLALGGEAGS